MAYYPCKEAFSNGTVATNHVSDIKLKWSLKTDQLRLYRTGDMIKSPSFGEDGKETLWRLILYPCGETKESAGYVSIFLE